MATFWVKETFVNETKGYQFGDEPWHEEHAASLGALFRDKQSEYGRVESRMGLDVPGKGFVGAHTVFPVGWVFHKRMRYEDARGNRPEDHYIREVWVQVRDVPPAEYHRTQGYGRRRPARSRPAWTGRPR